MRNDSEHWIRAAATALLCGLAVALQSCTDSEARQPAATGSGNDKYCTRTADAVGDACAAEAMDDHLIAVANCINVGDDDARAACDEQADEALAEAQEECGEQTAARAELCAVLGEARYDPAIDPLQFVDPTLIGTAIAPNPYLSLVPGYRRVYENGEETITVVVTDQTVEILGVTCVVVRDTATEDGEVIEDTDDWFAQDLEGNVWYFGELSRNYEDGQLVDLEGSFKAGVDGAKPGIVMKATPQVGDVYRQEWALGDAEDLAEVISTTASESTAAASCDGNCLQTRDFTPLEPGTSEYKFYAPGIGEIVAYHVEEPEEREELVEYGAE
ncbi:MAG: hypothetical protein WC809_19465 [Sinimarinibacterium sp.]|jgi:hypothetical protein